MSRVEISSHSVVKDSIVGPKCIISFGCKVMSGCVLGAGVKLESETFIENALVQSRKPEDGCKLY